MTMLIAIALATLQTQAQEVVWKQLALETIAKLPVEDRGGLGSLTTEDLTIDYPKEAEGKLVVLSKYGIGSVAFRTRDKSLANLRIELDQPARSDDKYDLTLAKSHALTVSQSLRPFFAEWVVASSRVGPADIYVKCTPTVGGIQSSEEMNYWFRSSDGKLFWISPGITLDYSRPYGKLITKEQAIQNAWSAYYRYRPFPVSRISYASLILSTYTQHAHMESAGSELTNDELTMAKNFVAVPLYIIGINIGVARGPAQTITVDAQTGKVKTIWDTGGAIGGGAPIKNELVGSKEIELTIGSTHVVATLAPGIDPLKLIHKDWKVVPVVSKTDSYAARLDPADRLWLAGSEGWYCYVLPKDAKRAAQAAAIAGPKFGAPKSG